MSKRSRKKRAKQHGNTFKNNKTTVADELRARERARANEHWRKRLEREEREARQAAARERIRNMKMPSHPAPLTDDEWYRKHWR